MLIATMHANEFLPTPTPRFPLILPPRPKKKDRFTSVKQTHFGIPRGLSLFRALFCCFCLFVISYHLSLLHKLKSVTNMHFIVCVKNDFTICMHKRHLVQHISLLQVFYVHSMGNEQILWKLSDYGR